MTAPITVEELRRKYPEPSVCAGAKGHRQNGYCVGGALVRFLAGDAGNRFPTVEQLTHTLVGITDLTVDDAMLIAQHIVVENDQGNFDVAWAWLDKGLSA